MYSYSYVCFVLGTLYYFVFMSIVCVNVHCTIATGCQLNCRSQIYHTKQHSVLTFLSPRPNFILILRHIYIYIYIYIYIRFLLFKIYHIFIFSLLLITHHIKTTFALCKNRYPSLYIGRKGAVINKFYKHHPRLGVHEKKTRTLCLKIYTTN